MTPTCSELTSTLCGAPSCDSALVNAIWAARLTEVGALSAPGALAPMLRTLMMRPHLRCFIGGSSSRQKRIWANSLRSRSACHCSSVRVSDGPRVDWPALLTKMSTLPNSEMIWSQACLIASGFETSQLIAAILPLPPPLAPLAWIFCLASASAPASRARIATSAPEAKYSSAIANPSPLLPPVTMALRPSSRTSMISLLPRMTCRRRAGASLLCRQPVDLVHVFARQCPFAGADIGRDLIRRGRAGDYARHPGAMQQPTEGEVEQAMAARFAERFQPLDN